MSNTDGILVLVLSGLLPCEEASTSTPLVTALAASFFGFGELTSCDCTRCCALMRLTRCLRG
ncbi:hypothetical protein PF005_g12149 [Phytophthora fragariae]|uniref:Secreted protein n=2 Tax=Phytophthora TaxID=4783 RepID=A0A6A3T4T2_9STRA|nr:hypothetical protein PF003_g19717 [Phytophthora fragariae]KAE9010745.1 hypothetical protein PR002_g15276 [Phytophthora rubi]KAE8943447.1 hypothetical protein PF009_g6833 [Phytophthora fragariae]KAE9008201.1 hypothetical protein PF011_g10795 [Phytophthora fragariae]KAE9010748.1 hypothetical protein PR002_g15278 [Phytophthora rubi]